MTGDAFSIYCDLSLNEDCSVSNYHHLHHYHHHQSPLMFSTLLFYLTGTVYMFVSTQITVAYDIILQSIVHTLRISSL